MPGLCSVHKSSSTNQVEVASAVYKVTAISPGMPIRMLFCLTLHDVSSIPLHSYELTKLSLWCGMIWLLSSHVWQVSNDICYYTAKAANLKTTCKSCKTTCILFHQHENATLIGIAGQLFPHEGRNNFCYVSIDTLKKQCRLLYHAIEPFW